MNDPLSKTQSHRANSILNEALKQQPSDERYAFVADRCGDNTELLEEVRSLIAAHENAPPEFLDPVASPATPNREPLIAEKAGDVVGSYTLRNQIGEGGFGSVWKAEQTGAIARMVALKIVKPGLDTKAVLTRFEAERQAVAMMDHPNIARVFDAGATAAGRPFFVMELVDGAPISQFCNQHKLGLRRRLELFADVCAAIHHAHQKGIIHRDIKPNNVLVSLVDEKPLVKVIDFGVAKATQGKLTERTLYTPCEQFIGTPVYMSPEQATGELDVDTRSDIYGLGVLLYELLAGAPPFDPKSLLSAGYGEMFRIIAEKTPPNPSTRRSQIQLNGEAKESEIRSLELSGELDWIIMKAIEKDRSRRYETAIAFADDISRYLNGEPVQAAAPSMVYKFRKFVRRNKVVLSAAAMMILLLLAGSAATAWQAVVATGERDRAITAEQLAANRLRETESAYRQSEAALMEAKSVSTLLSEILNSPRPEIGGEDVRVVDLLEEAATRIDSAKDISPDRIASLRSEVATTLYRLGRREQSLKLREEVLENYTYAPFSRSKIASQLDLSVSYYDAKRFSEALELRLNALESSREFLPPVDPLSIRALGNLANSYEQAENSKAAQELRLEAARYGYAVEQNDESNRDLKEWALEMAQIEKANPAKREGRGSDGILKLAREDSEAIEAIQRAESYSRDENKSQALDTFLEAFRREPEQFEEKHIEIFAKAGRLQDLVNFCSVSNLKKMGYRNPTVQLIEELLSNDTTKPQGYQLLERVWSTLERAREELLDKGPTFWQDVPNLSTYLRVMLVPEDMSTMSSGWTMIRPYNFQLSKEIHVTDRKLAKIQPLLSNRSELQQFAEELKQVIERYPNWKVGIGFLCFAESELGNYQRATSLLAQILEDSQRQPIPAGSAWMLGQNLEGKDPTLDQLVMNLYEYSLEQRLLDPYRKQNRVSAARQLARLYFKNGQSSKARELLNRMMVDNYDGTKEACSHAGRIKGSYLAMDDLWVARGSECMGCHQQGRNLLDVTIMSHQLSDFGYPVDALVALGRIDASFSNAFSGDVDWQNQVYSRKEGIDSRRVASFNNAKTAAEIALTPATLIEALENSAFAQSDEMFDLLPGLRGDGGSVRLISPVLEMLESAAKSDAPSSLSDMKKLTAALDSLATTHSENVQLGVTAAVLTFLQNDIDAARERMQKLEKMKSPSPVFWLAARLALEHESTKELGLRLGERSLEGAPPTWAKAITSERDAIISSHEAKTQN